MPDTPQTSDTLRHPGPGGAPFTSSVPEVNTKLAELRAKNEAAAKAHEESAKPAPSEPVKEPRRETPWALRAIAADGNVLKAVDWILERDPTEEEKDKFRRSIPRAVSVDLVRPKG